MGPAALWPQRAGSENGSGSRATAAWAADRLSDSARGNSMATLWRGGQMRSRNGRCQVERSWRFGTALAMDL
eukprot:scaffold7735_cov248-Pinguiococcus_pyrenoidosus.AAC.3